MRAHSRFSVGSKRTSRRSIDLRVIRRICADGRYQRSQRALLQTKCRQDIPITYVPARNTIFLSFALAWAEVLECSDIFIGVNALDYSGYPDCRPEFIEAFERLANLATKAGVEGRQSLKIHTPLISLSKAEIISKGRELGVDYGLTSSCYDPSPSGEPCGACDSCLLRQKGFRENGLIDPLKYRGATTEVRA